MNDIKIRCTMSLQIDLSSYAPGVYLIQLVNNHRVVGVRKVVKQ